MQTLNNKNEARLLQLQKALANGCDVEHEVEYLKGLLYNKITKNHAIYGIRELIEALPDELAIKNIRQLLSYIENYDNN